MNEQRAAFESWYMSKHKKLPTCPAEWAFLKSENGRYVNQLTQTWFEIYRAALASPEVRALRDALVIAEDMLCKQENELRSFGADEPCAESAILTARSALAAMEKKVMKKLFCDLKTDEEKSAFFLSGRGHETGIIASAIQNDVAMAYHRCTEYKKELDALRSQDREDVTTLKAGLEEAAQTMRAVLAQERLKAVAKRCLSRAIGVCDRAIDHARRVEGDEK